MKKFIANLLCILVLFGGVLGPLFFGVASAQSSPPQSGADLDSDGYQDQIECPEMIGAFEGSTIICSDNNGDGLPDYADPSYPGDDGYSTTVQEQQAVSDNGYNSSRNTLPSCGVIGDSSVSGCMVQLAYYVGLYPSTWIASLSGQLFDFFLAYTLSDDSYRSSFVSEGWKIVRDIANIAFIFALLYIAVSIILDVGGHDVKKSLARLILIAIVINFSFFFTNMIIDVGNILARAFYQSIEIRNETNAGEGYKSMSVGILENINPQGILSSDIFAPDYSEVEAENFQDNDVVDEKGTRKPPGHGYLVLIILVATAINLFLAYVFFSVAIFLIARVLGLWILIIFSPVAFLSVGIPFKLGNFGWSEWFKQLTNLAFLAPVFMFFFYLIVKFTGVAFSSFDFTSGQLSVTQKIMGILIPLFAISMLMKIAKDKAKEMSGQFGDVVVGALKKGAMVAAGGAALGIGATAALGGAALRGSVGRLASSRLKSEKYKDWASKSRFGRFTTEKFKGVAGSGMDLRNSKVSKFVGGKVGQLGGAAGLNLNPSMTSGMYSGTQKGGFQTRRDAKEAEVKKKDEEFKEYLKVDDKKNVTIDKDIKYKDEGGSDVTIDAGSEEVSVEKAKENLAQKQREAKSTGEYDDINKRISKREKEEKNLKEQYEVRNREFQASQKTQADRNRLQVAQLAYNNGVRNRRNAESSKRDFESKWAREKAVLDAATAQVSRQNSKMMHTLTDAMIRKQSDGMVNAINFAHGQYGASQRSRKSTISQFRHEAENLSDVAEKQQKKNG